jgi:hypothetical protein
LQGPDAPQPHGSARADGSAIAGTGASLATAGLTLIRTTLNSDAFLDKSEVELLPGGKIPCKGVTANQQG